MKVKCAGHEFRDQSVDSPCILQKSDGSACRMTRATLFQVTEADIGQPGFAHMAHLNRSEYDEILEDKKEYELRCEKMMEALRSVCG